MRYKVFRSFLLKVNSKNNTRLWKSNTNEGKKVEMIEVEIKKLDDVLPPEVKIDFIKIDVEGAEYEVLEGAERTITKYKPVVLFEHAKIHNVNYETTPEKIYNLLMNKYNLGIYSLDGTGPLSLNDLTIIYTSSFESGYDRNAQTNFLARAV